MNTNVGLPILRASNAATHFLVRYPLISARLPVSSLSEVSLPNSTEVVRQEVRRR